MKQKIKTILSDLGLSERQIEIYMKLLQLGEVTGYQLSQELGLTRSTVYFVLDELRAKNLVLKSPGKKKQLYSAKDPESFFIEKQQNLQQLEALLPEIRSLAKTYQKTHVHTFDGYRELQNSLRYFLEATSGQSLALLLTYSPEGVTEERAAFATFLFDSLSERKQSVRAILPDHEPTKTFVKNNKNSNITWRTLDTKMYSPQVAKYVAETAVLYVARVPGTQTGLVEIFVENENMAHAEKQLFEIVWAQGKEFE